MWIYLNEVGHSQLDAADNNVGYNMQFDSNSTYRISEDSYPVLFSSDNSTTIPSISFDVPIGPSNAVSTDSVLDDSVELLIEQSTTFLGKEFVTIVEVENFYQKYAYIIGFSIRKDELRQDKHDLITICRWICSKEGY
ncbi:hypothetical protein LWI29_020155 [Acer saccharum]|uniref:FAR1 domain-containing protein n=1 Tax=Acer saccharum TaxID=4024 RepID=A0AA39RSH1_ACESA|nr:hypothetical protein LWI29_020155 [Acer saccharum]